MNELLAIVRWAFTLPVWLLEHVLKGLTLIVLVFALIVMAIFFPLFRYTWRSIDKSLVFKYATKWKGNYPLTKKVFSLWQ